MQLRGVSKVATLTWMGHGFGLCRSRSGTVKWFDPQRGFGFIQSEGEDYFVHYSNIESTGFRSLADHEEVEFDVSEGDKGKKFCTNVTGPGGAPEFEGDRIQSSGPGFRKKFCTNVTGPGGAPAGSEGKLPRETRVRCVS
ncbi:Cold shock domain-containing protein 4 [Symbiodinium microadriaticum]|uniref:Cold shock domain-containing protein 4 n=1 Tax=Symbiodinium microadriaticum TaxID=2951 RepID=A0A1Q9CN13_SYMMI|nr:Cold shock domain-containing protein 4 [Symbiodinium microadriaticum]